jgi:hypothetical protein
MLCVCVSNEPINVVQTIFTSSITYIGYLVGHKIIIIWNKFATCCNHVCRLPIDNYISASQVLNWTALSDTRHTSIPWLAHMTLRDRLHHGP